MSALQRRSYARLVRRGLLTLPLLLVAIVLASLAGAAAGVAQETPTPTEEAESLEWGPAPDSPPLLNDLRVLEAVDLAVDEDAISASVLGGTKRLVFVCRGVEGCHAPDGSTAFDPEQARLLLEAAGVESLMLTLAADGTDPQVMQAAEAIAEDLRNNLGIQMTVGPNPYEDLAITVLEVPPMPTPEPPLGPVDLSYDVTCTPDTFRPDEWVAVECITRFVNQGQSALTDISVSIGGYSGPTPSYFFMWSAHDGEFAPVSTGALSFEHRDLGPGEAAVSSIVLLLEMGEGAFETELRASVKGQAVDSVPIRFVATAGAAEPPTDLVVTSELVTEVSEEPQPTATYRTTITNQGSSEVTDLTLTERYTEWVALVSADPAPASQSPGVQLASWDLASFGRGSLAPGESLVLRTTYGPAERADCGWASSGFVVEATVDGQEQRYGARPSVEQLVGECAYPQIGGGGELPTTLGRGGEGPAPLGGGASWPAAALACTGLVLIGTGLAARRRALSR